MVFTTDVKEETYLGPTVVYSAFVNVEDEIRLNEKALQMLLLI